MGKSREFVEAYLKSRNIRFFLVGEGGRWNDYIEIGEENPPPFCSNQKIFAVLEFLGPQRTGRDLIMASDNDTLAEIRLSDAPGGCL